MHAKKNCQTAEKNLTNLGRSRMMVSVFVFNVCSLSSGRKAVEIEQKSACNPFRVPEGETPSRFCFGSVAMRQQKPEERRPKANSYFQAMLAALHFIIS
jgi:hypothetical protein